MDSFRARRLRREGLGSSSDSSVAPNINPPPGSKLKSGGGGMGADCQLASSVRCSFPFSVFSDLQILDKLLLSSGPCLSATVGPLLVKIWIFRSIRFFSRIVEFLVSRSINEQLWFGSFSTF